MVAKKTVAVAADNLVRLGAERLAEILLELAGGSRVSKAGCVSNWPARQVAR